MQRKFFLDYSRALGILAVVWVHVMSRIDHNFAASLKPITFILNTATFLPVIFIVSGCLAGKYIMQDVHSLGDCFWRYFKSILVPFYSLSMLFFVFNVIAGGFIEGLPGAMEMATALLTFDMGSNLPSGVLWFFFTLFLFSMTVSIWKKIINISAGYLLVAAIFLNVFLATAYMDCTYFSIGKYIAYLCNYVFGVFFSEYILGIKRNFKIELFLSCAYIGSVVLFGLIDVYPLKRLCFVAATLSGPMLVLHLLYRSECFANMFAARALQYIGINAIVIYAFHVPSFKVILPVLAQLHMLASWLGLMVWIALGVGIPLLIGLVLSSSPCTYRILFARSPVIST